MKHTIAQLKQMSRAMLLGKWRKAVNLTLYTFVLTMLLSMCTNPFVSNTTTMGTVVYCVVSLIITLISGLFSAGASFFYLNMCRGKEYRYRDLFATFKMNPDRFLIVAFITNITTFIATMPSIFWIPDESDYYTYIVVSLACMAIGVVITIILSLFFGLANYLLLDFPEMGTREALQMSISLMKGNKGRFFRLQLSFIGWALLSSLSFGIGFLWIQPYMNMAYTYFYTDVLGQLNDNPSDEPVTEY